VTFRKQKCDNEILSAHQVGQAEHTMRIVRRYVMCVLCALNVMCCVHAIVEALYSHYWFVALPCNCFVFNVFDVVSYRGCGVLYVVLCAMLYVVSCLYIAFCVNCFIS
jgi:hypothetical protein